MSALTGHVRYAFNPRQGASSNGGYHIVLDQPLSAGRLSREAGDALCKRAAAFWGLERGNPDQQPTCTSCLKRAERYGVTVSPKGVAA
ncbi:hypothetical protein [Streptomyces macrosporus]|uniref:Uncharacterized protein n=1 Tax=Streptomyces macrosporus TaxID=44032 RepID=A0ABP5XQL6_9ACTN